MIRPIVWRAPASTPTARAPDQPDRPVRDRRPEGRRGLTGRKIIVDTYGGASRHGGGAFSGKDPSKVDRSAAYAMRWVAKNAVAAGLADKPRGAGRLRDRQGVTGRTVRRDLRHRRTWPTRSIIEAIREVFDLRPAAIIRDLDLLRPIYAQTATYGHFGRDLPDFTWERLDRVDAPAQRSRAVAMTDRASIARVLIDSPLPQLDRLFDYRDPRGARRLPQCRACGSRCRSGRRGSPSGYHRRARRPSRVHRCAERTGFRRLRGARCSRQRCGRSRGGSPTAPAARASDIVRLAVPKRQVRVEKAWLGARAAEQLRAGARRRRSRLSTPTRVRRRSLDAAAADWPSTRFPA